MERGGLCQTGLLGCGKLRQATAFVFPSRCEVRRPDTHHRDRVDKHRIQGHGLRSRYSSVSWLGSCSVVECGESEIGSFRCGHRLASAPEHSPVFPTTMSFSIYRVGVAKFSNRVRKALRTV